MPSVCLYVHAHQPRRLRKLRLADGARPAGATDLEARYFNDDLNRHYFEKAARQCYRPANAVLLRALGDHPDFRVSLSVTGTLLEQAERFDAGVLGAFAKLVDTGRVEVLAETHHHSLASLYDDPTEFREQVREHRDALWRAFGVRPTAFRNTEVLYNNAIAADVERMGYRAILSEGVERVLGWRSPNYVYAPKGAKRLRLLLRNYPLSDDVGYRFASRGWAHWPLTADKYASWLAAAPGDTVNVFMDYETFGEHHWRDTGILDFLAHLPREAGARGLEFLTVTQTAERHPVRDAVDVPDVISWADLERDASAWLGNKMQRKAFADVQELARRARETGDASLVRTARLLQTSDHLYYLCTKSLSDGDVHAYFSPYKDQNPYENYVDYANVLRDFARVLDERVASRSGTLRVHGGAADPVRVNEAYYRLGARDAHDAAQPGIEQTNERNRRGVSREERPVPHY